MQGPRVPGVSVLTSFDGGYASDNTDFTLDGGAYNTVNVDIISAGDPDGSGDFLVNGAEL